MTYFLQRPNLVSLFLGTLCVALHGAYLFWRTEKAQMLQQLAIYPSNKVALTN